jgi:tetratricopeptide (TPR) repeat protein
VLALDSTHAQASAWLANLYEEEGRMAEALSYMQRAWRYGRGNLEFAYELGTLLLEQGRFEEAHPLLERVTTAQPWNAGAHYNLGSTLIALGHEEEGQRLLAVTDQLQDLDQEIAYAQAAVARYPDEPARWRVLAELFGRAGRREEQQHAYLVARSLAQAPPTPRED